MARRNPVREGLLAEVKNRQRAATRKINRIEHGGGKIKGTAHDPRILDSNVLALMSTRELRSHLGRVNAFIDRKTQFTPLFGGTVVPRSKWNAYTKEEAGFNATVQRINASVESIELPGSNTSIGQRIDMLKQGKRRMGGVNRIYQEIHREPKFIASEKDLDTLIADMRNRNSRDYLEKALSPRLNSIDALLKHSGNEDFIPVLHGLTPEQQLHLIDNTNFLELARERFSSPTTGGELVEAMDRDYEIRNGVSREFDVHIDIQRNIDWVTKTFPKGTSGNVRSEYTDTTAKPVPIQRRRWNKDNTDAGLINLPYTDTTAKPIPVQRRKPRKPRSEQ